MIDRSAKKINFHRSTRAADTLFIHHFSGDRRNRPTEIKIVLNRVEELKRLFPTGKN